MKRILKWLAGSIIFLYALGWIGQFLGVKPEYAKKESPKEINSSNSFEIKATDIIYKSTYPKEWPFTKDTIKIFCKDQAIWLVTYPEGKIYGLNGYAKSYLESENTNAKIHIISEIQIKYKSNEDFLSMGKRLCL
ncbi:MAG: DUF2511 domain-containing protein [Sediminibacterium sp.]|jgi:hypothetical protein|nr:DUF2511 domain-containing protein [Sediminibacterium sp.]